MYKKLYYWIFQETPGEGALLFLKHFTVATFGVIGASLINFIVNILAGKWLGAEEFGKAQFFIATATIISVVMLFGINGTIPKKIYSDTDPEEKRKFRSNISLFLLINIGVVGLFMILMAKFLPDFLEKININNHASIFLIFILAVIITYRLAWQAWLQAMKKFTLLSLLQIGGSIAAIISFFVLFFFLPKNFLVFFWAIAFSHFILAAAWLTSSIKDRFAENTASETIKKMYLFSGPVFLTGIFGILMIHLDRVLIQSFMDSRSVGIYSAYFTLSLQIISQILTALLQVILPTFAQKKLTPEINRKIKKSIFMSAPVMYAISLIMMTIGEKLYGAEFAVSWQFKMLFALYAVLYFIFQYLGTILAAAKEKGFHLFAWMNFWGVVIFVTGFFIFQPLFGLDGVVLSQIIAYALLNFFCVFYFTRKSATISPA